MSKNEETAQELLDTFNKARTREQEVAEKAGFNSIEKYKEYLEMKIKLEELGENGSKEEIIIEHIAVLDCSYSMGGRDIINARSGLKEDFNSIDKSDTYKLIPFGNIVDEAIEITSERDFSKFSATMGATALYDATAKAIDLAVKSDNKCLIKIFTDGGENSSIINKSALKEKMEEAKSLHITVTFIGLKDTIKGLVNSLNVSESNTLTYDGSPEGMKKSFKQMSRSTVAYTAKAKAGEDVTEGFYKTLN